MEHTNKLLLKGNEAVVYGALLAGCDCFFGYPITPASEIAHAAAEYFPRLKRVFLQAESETAAINMVLGSAAAGRRVMTASSGLGISLKQEGMSYLAASELPAVIVDIMRSGPGLGNIGPEQTDYFQVVKGGGHGGYRCIVLAPNSVQEMCDFALTAFDLADRYLIPVYILTDGVVGQMMELVELPEPVGRRPSPPWALDSDCNPRTNMITSIFLEYDDLEHRRSLLEAKYAKIVEKEQLATEYMVDDADVVITGHGIISRLIVSAVDALRANGVKAGMIRPITLFPFPVSAFSRAAKHVKQFLCVEMSNGQMLEDVKLSIDCSRPVQLLSRMGGNIPSVDSIIAAAEKIVSGTGKKCSGGNK